MCVFGGFENWESPVLGLERRRESEGVPKWSVFGAFFAIFGRFFSKSASFFAKMGRELTIFENFEKGTVVIALNLKINHEGHEDHEEGKILDRIYGINRSSFWPRIARMTRILRRAKIQRCKGTKFLDRILFWPRILRIHTN